MPSRWLRRRSAPGKDAVRGLVDEAAPKTAREARCSTTHAAIVAALNGMRARLDHLFALSGDHGRPAAGPIPACAAPPPSAYCARSRGSAVTEPGHAEEAGARHRPHLRARPSGQRTLEPAKVRGDRLAASSSWAERSTRSRSAPARRALGCLLRGPAPDRGTEGARRGHRRRLRRPGAGGTDAGPAPHPSAGRDAGDHVHAEARDRSGRTCCWKPLSIAMPADSAWVDSSGWIPWLPGSTQESTPALELSFVSARLFGGVDSPDPGWLPKKPGLTLAKCRATPPSIGRSPERNRDFNGLAGGGESL